METRKIVHTEIEFGDANRDLHVVVYADRMVGLYCPRFGNHESMSLRFQPEHLPALRKLIRELEKIEAREKEEGPGC